MDRSRASRRAAAVTTTGMVTGMLTGVLAGGLVVSLAAPAAAHVTLTASTTAAGATAVLRMVVPHGCAGSATTELAVRIPVGVTEVSAQSTQRWAAEASDTGVTFRTDDPLPDALRDEVAFSVRLPDDAGAELVFPVVQRCQEGESAWTEVAPDAADREQLDMPAPVVTVTAADGSASAALPPPSEARDGELMAYGAAGVLLVGCLATGALLILRRRRA
ncbi:DUF1775 domain-containing protein [Nocardioides sp. SYSU D00065]|uniref:DUF1775 domain-containing protein n=1 Tax=Nocardioides sp. SYSU D00065 TaxID=2817378 RepID=UPI001B319C32|nr:DUF1775 domain-containing protein [Nocardioides sp. SYSU D00065]